jgi:predicted MFS family arabinose efflux permease
MPLGAILGGVLVEESGNPSLLYICAGSGIAITAALALLLSPETRAGAIPPEIETVGTTRVAVDEA